MWHWIADREAFLSWWPQVEEAEEIGVDTESDSFYAYRSSICLLQIAAGEEIGLIDVFALGDEEKERLFSLFSQSSPQKIVHSCMNDILGFQRDYGISWQGVFDTEIAAGFLGLEKRGLSSLLEMYFQVKPNKKFQRFDWRIRPLPREALAYAAEDVRYLGALKALMMEELLSRGWADAVIEESSLVAAQVSYEERPFDLGGFRKMKGAKELSSSEQALLQALYLARHAICLDENRAAFWVVSDQALVEMARRRPKNLYELSKIAGMHAKQIGRYGEIFLQALEKALSMKRRAPVVARKESKPPMEKVEQEELLQMRAWRQALGEREGVDGSLLFSNQHLKAILLAKPKEYGDLLRLSILGRWRVERYGDLLLEEIAEIL